MPQLKTAPSSSHFYAVDANWQPASKLPKTIGLSGEILDATHIGATYDTVPGNQPATNSNLVAIWQSAGIPYGQAPDQKKLITKNQPTGDQIFEFQIQRKPYIIGYGTSDTNTAWAGTVQFTPGEGTKGVTFVTHIDVQAAGSDSLLAIFKTPLNNNPSANGNWVGLWNDSQPTWDGSKRIKKVNVGANTAEGSQSMSGLDLLMNSTYCLAYAVGPKESDLAAWVTFITQPF